MGYTSLVDMIAFAGPETALEWHLSSNFFPRLPDEHRALADKVITLAKTGLLGAVDLVEGLGGYVRVEEIINNLHLEPFIEFYAQQEVSSESD